MARFLSHVRALYPLLARPCHILILYPGMLQVLSENPCVLTLRDTDSVLSLRDRLTGARRVLVVGE